MMNVIIENTNEILATLGISGTAIVSYLIWHLQRDLFWAIVRIVKAIIKAPFKLVWKLIKLPFKRLAR